MDTSLFARARRFAQKYRLTGTARRVLSDNLTYLSPGKFLRIEKSLEDVLQRNVKGDIQEFGVALGGSAVVLASTATRAGRAFQGFDVFGMIPEPSSDKDDEKARERYRIIRTGRSKGINGETYYGYRDNLYEEVVASFDRYGLHVDGERITLFKGLFTDTWPRRPPGPIAFAHIDCDWYEPVAFCLEAVSAQLSVGGVIVLDDYHDYKSCRAATDAFLAGRSDFRFDDGPNVVLRRVAGPT